MLKRFYYGSKISNNLVKLDDGYLLCLNVPIARTGAYQYTREELGLDGSGIVTVYREPSEVFDQVAMASFEGKAFTDTHPNVDVNVDNWQIYSKGELTNIRRGTGDKSNLLLSDIIVRDPAVINEIYSGAKREISAGYDCEYVEENGKIYQRNIRGNHAALVQCGRAGHLVKINDEYKINKKYNVIKKISKAIKVLTF